MFKFTRIQVLNNSSIIASLIIPPARHIAKPDHRNSPVSMAFLPICETLLKLLHGFSQVDKSILLKSNTWKSSLLLKNHSWFVPMYSYNLSYHSYMGIIVSIINPFFVFPLSSLSWLQAILETFSTSQKQLGAQNNLVSILDTAYWIDPLFIMVKEKQNRTKAKLLSQLKHISAAS